MTKDNLAKRGIEKPPACVFCTDNETIDHLFFGCVVAKQIWVDVADTFGFISPKNILELSSFWNLNNKKSVTNIACVATI